MQRRHVDAPTSSDTTPPPAAYHELSSVAPSQSQDGDIPSSTSTVSSTSMLAASAFSHDIATQQETVRSTTKYVPSYLRPGAANNPNAHGASAANMNHYDTVDNLKTNSTGKKATALWSGNLEHPMHYKQETLDTTSMKKNFKQTFQYDARLAILLLPCMALMFLSGGTWFITTVVVGITIAYILDAIGVHEAAFMFGWVTVTGAIVSICIFNNYGRTSLYTTFILFTMTTTILLIGFIYNLHVDWFNEEFEWLSIMIEQLVFSTVGFPTTVLMMLAVISYAGVESAPFYLVLIQHIAYRLTMVPLKASFQEYKPGRKDDDKEAEVYTIVGPVASAVHTSLLVWFPCVMYLCLHYRNLISWLALSDLILLICIPILLLATMVHQDVLWWMWDLESSIQAQPAMFAFFGSLATGCIEYRVIIHSFSHYLYYEQTHPFFSHFLLTIAMFSSLVACLLLLKGFAHPRGLSSLTQPLILLFKFAVHTCAITSALVIGIPFYLLPFVMIGAYTGIHFLFHRRFIHYLLFVIAFTVAVSWFIHKNYWFLRVSFSSYSIQSISVILTLLMILALLLPGLTIVNVSPVITGLLLLVHACGMTWLEYLFSNENETYDSPLYGFYLVILTSVVGAVLSYRLHEEHKITHRLSWLLTTIYIAKLSILIASDWYDVMCAIMAVAAITPLFVLYSPLRRMTPRQGIFHAITIVIAIFLCRNTVIAHILRLIMLNRPSSSLVFATFLITSAIALLPLSFQHFAYLPSVRRANTIAIVLAILFAIIQPETTASDIQFAYDTTHGLTSIWTSWLLFAALALLIIAVTAILPLPRLLFAITFGSCLGLYVCGLVLPFNFLLYTLFVALFNTISIFLVYLHWPTYSSPTIMAFSYGTFIALFPIIAAISHITLAYAPRIHGQDMIQLVRVMLFGVHAALNAMVALLVKLESETSTPKEKKEMKSSTYGYLRRSSGILPTVPVQTYIGNAAALLAFILGTILQLHLMDGSTSSIFVIAPVLLLLQRDAGIWSNLTHTRRYFPVCAAIIGYLYASSVYSTIWYPILGNLGWVTRIGPTDWFFVVKNIVLLAVATPSQYQLLDFIWNWRKTSYYFLLFFGPPNLLPIIIADHSALQWLGGIGLIGCIAQLFIFQRMHQKGLELI